MENQDKQELFKVTVHVVGVKKRCRKSDRHIFNLGYIPYNDGVFDQEDLERKAEALLEENMKSISEVPSVDLNHVKISGECGFRSEEWRPFSDKNKSFKLLSPLEKVLD